jgi:hypothetical protein
MKRAQQITRPPGCEDFRLVFRQARDDILFIGIHHHPIQLTPKAELARFKEKVGQQDRLYIEGSSRMHFQKDWQGLAVSRDRLEGMAYAHYKGEKIFLDDLSSANRLELAKKYGLRPYAFAGLYACFGLCTNVTNGYFDSDELYFSTSRFLDIIRGWGEKYFPIKGSERAARGAIEAAIKCQEDFGSLKPLGDVADTFARFNGRVRDAEVYGPLMTGVVSKTGGRNGVIIGSLHIDNLVGILEGRQLDVPDWSVYVERMSDDARVVYRSLMDALSKIGI